MITDDELLQQAAHCPTMYFDGFGAYRRINGVLRCVGYIFGAGAQLNLVVSLVGADSAQQATKRLLEDRPSESAVAAIWSGNDVSH